MEKEELIRIKLSEKEVEIRRNFIRRELIRGSYNIHNGEIKNISVEDLKLIFILYNKYFFNNFFREKFKGKINFSVSGKMNKSAGKTIVPRVNFSLSEDKQVYEIRIGINFFLQYYGIEREKVVGGIETKDALHALLMVFEHEIIHILEFYVFGNSSCKNNRFKAIALNIFHHKDVYHSLPTYREIVEKNLGVQIGQKVTFLYRGVKKEGIINRINKRATVMALDREGAYIDKQGNRYTKYYVDLNGLNKI